MMRAYSFRAEEKDMERWAQIAAIKGMKLSEWIRVAASRQEVEDTASDGGEVREKRLGQAVRMLVKELELAEV